jgi:hypothetical protein
MKRRFHAATLAFACSLALGACVAGSGDPSTSTQSRVDTSTSQTSNTATGSKTGNATSTGSASTTSSGSGTRTETGNSTTSSATASASRTSTASATQTQKTNTATATATSATATATGTGSGGGAGKAFNQCRFHFGTIDSVAKNNSALIQQLDFFTPGWMGQSDTFDMKYVCDETAANGAYANKTPVIVAYLAAFYTKRHDNVQDCNIPGATRTLCKTGAAYIQQNLSKIIDVYKSYSQGFANCYGTTKPIIFEMEPDWYQYTISEQSQPMTPAKAGEIMGQFVTALRSSLPNALFSLDISPWVGNNGADNGKAWFSNFKMSDFSFINTSGGGTDAANAKIRSSNQMTWAGVHAASGKPILADTGYGVNGASAGHDAAWDVVANINARMADGVIGISQYNPNSNWANTISSIRSNLKTPDTCP